MVGVLKPSFELISWDFQDAFVFIDSFRTFSSRLFPNRMVHNFVCIHISIFVILYFSLYLIIWLPCLSGSFNNKSFTTTLWSCIIPLWSQPRNHVFICFHLRFTKLLNLLFLFCTIPSFFIFPNQQKSPKETGKRKCSRKIYLNVSYPYPYIFSTRNYWFKKVFLCTSHLSPPFPEIHTNQYILLTSYLILQKS